MTKIRIASLAVTLLLCFGIFAGCAPSSPVVMKVDGKDVYANDYAYYLKTYKESMESASSPDIWSDKESGDSYVEYVKSLAADQVILRQAVASVSFRYHWYWRSPPLASTVNSMGVPTTPSTSAGWVTISG